MAKFPPSLQHPEWYPAMYVKTETVLTRRNYFLKNKRIKFKEAGIEVPPSIFVSKNAYYAFLRDVYSNYGIVVLYFAVDDNNSLTMVVAVAKDTGVKPEKYYYLEEGNILPDDGRVQGWIKRYQDVFDCLDGTYDKNDDSPTDTQLIWYEMNNMVEIASELLHQEQTNKYFIYGFWIWFSAYTDTDQNPKPDEKKIIKKRFIVQLMIVYDNDGSDDILYIDTLGEPRTAPPFRSNQFDTGNICPPACNGFQP